LVADGQWQEFVWAVVVYDLYQHKIFHSNLLIS